MNRCPSHRLRGRNLLLAVGLTMLHVLPTPSMAQTTTRPFPPAAQRGAMQIIQPPNLLMDGKPGRLSPGARIHDVNNMLVLSGALAGKPLLVNYLLEPQGLVHEVWILSPAEAQLIPAKAAP
jgi:hypothetical protein